VLGEKDRIRPQRRLMVMIGALVGIFLGAFAALMRNSFVVGRQRSSVG
jgi:LPS O-antigen subunit length determinant protein (WzzB/FepE family)